MKTNFGIKPASASTATDKTTTDATAIFFKEVDQCFTLSREAFSRLFYEGVIADGRSGGLVIGRRHDEGHIPLIRAVDSGYEVYSVMEGGEFILNHGSTSQFSDELVNLNSEDGSVENGLFDFKETLPRIIDTRALTTKMILTGGNQYIVNRFATQKYIERLIEINEVGNDMTSTDPFSLLRFS